MSIGRAHSGIQSPTARPQSADASHSAMPGWEALLPDRPAVMGVLNVTADSFSDGGCFLDPGAAVAHAATLVAAGADFLDIGGESTRPGAEPVSAAEELQRVVPVIRAIRDAGIRTPISIDTRKAEVAEAAVLAGADAVNDVSALAHDPVMAATVARLGAPLVLMHMAGNPRTMQNNPQYGSVVQTVVGHLAERAAFAIAQGISRSHLALDPGIGFGKSIRHNLLLIKHLDKLCALGFPVLLGTSRKSFIGHLLGDRPATEREWGTAASIALGVAAGARMVRVHRADAMSDVVQIAHAICNA